MNEIAIIFDDRFKSSCGCINTTFHTIYINVKLMIEEAKIDNMTFTERFMQTVSHEIIHQIITDVESDYASDEFDNICYRKYNKIKHWIGGVGGKK